MQGSFREHKSFKEMYTLEERRKKKDMKAKQFPDLIPIIIEKHKKTKLPALTKNL